MVPRALARSAPELALYLAGADPFAGDRLGRLALSKAGLAGRDRYVLHTLRDAGVPVAVTMAGGYAEAIADVVDIPDEFRGTFKGAGMMAPYLKALGFNTVEFLPVQETQNDTNDVDPASTAGDNYWGYATLNYFAPDRRYAADKTAGGPTRRDNRRAAGHRRTAICRRAPRRRPGTTGR